MRATHCRSFECGGVATSSLGSRALPPAAARKFPKSTWQVPGAHSSLRHPPSPPAAAYKRQSVVITTNLEFSRWESVFGDDQMAAAVIDRIVHHGRLVQFRGESYHVRHVLMREG